LTFLVYMRAMHSIKWRKCVFGLYVHPESRTIRPKWTF
jgi:hypothetical protein